MNAYRREEHARASTADHCTGRRRLLDGPPPAFRHRLSGGRGARKPLRGYRTPSCAACPDRALPCYALLRAAVAGHCWRWGRRQHREQAAAAGGGGRPGGRGENAVSFSYPSTTVSAITSVGRKWRSSAACRSSARSAMAMGGNTTNRYRGSAALLFPPHSGEA
jgi:hypothetical protein